MKIVNNKKGFTFLSVLLALVIILILMKGYLGPDKDKEKNWAQTNIDRSKDTACMANRTVVVTSINMWVVNHAGEEVTIEKLVAGGFSVPSCPGGGKYTIGPKNEVYCSLHYPDPSLAPAKQAEIPKN